MTKRSKSADKGAKPTDKKIEVSRPADEIKADAASGAQQEEAKLGRPTDYKPEFATLALELCERGATDEEIASIFEVSVRTIYRWKANIPEFCQALRIGKHFADDRVERSLYQKATGYYVTEQEAIKLKIDQYKEEVEIVDVEKYVEPDTTSAIFWLKNRRKADWRDKQEVEHTASEELLTLLDQRRKRARGV